MSRLSQTISSLALWTAVIACLLSVVVAAGVSSPSLSSQDIKSIRDAVLKQSSLKTASGAYDAAVTFKSLGLEIPAEAKKTVCSSLSSSPLSASSSASSAFYTFAASSFFGCPSSSISSTASSIARRTIESSNTNVNDLLSAIQIAKLAKGSSDALPAAVLSSASERLRKLFDSSSGLFASSIESTGVAYSALATLVDAASPSVPDSVAELMLEVSEKLSSIAASAVESKSPAVASALLSGALRLPSIEEVPSESFAALVDIALDTARRSGSSAAIRLAIEALAAVSSSSSPFQPLTLSTASVSADKSSLSFSISDALGRPLSGLAASSMKVTLRSAEPASDELKQPNQEPLVSKATIVSASNGNTFSARLPSSPSAGLYTLVISAAATDKADQRRYMSLDRVSRTLTIPAALQVSNVVLKIRQQDESKRMVDVRSSSVAAYPGTLAGGDLSMEERQRLVVSFRVTSSNDKKAFVAQQVFLRLSSSDNAQSTVFVAKLSDASEGTYSLTIEGKAAGQALSFTSGSYEIALLVADPAAASPIEWRLGTLELSFTSQPPAQRRTVHYGLRPEITHKFREPESRPSTPTAALFTYLVPVPLFIFIIALFRMGYNLSNFPSPISNTIEFVFAVGFLGSILSLLLILYAYFLSADLYQTLMYMLAVGAAAIAFGYGALTRLAIRRETDAAKEIKSE